MVEFEKDCGWENFMYPNFTAMPDRPRIPGKNQSVELPTPVSAKKARQRLLGKRRLDTVSVRLEASSSQKSAAIAAAVS